ncbi:Mif2/CENP-C like-domain-containing protein [Melampsora americana]|nr:Mif2/CENP-C like-domain-containing protein [Melampsora americana]
MAPRVRPAHSEVFHPNFDPGVTGRRTGIVPPKDVRRGSDGFERFSDYDPSPQKFSPLKQSPLKQAKRIRTQRPDKFHEIGERGRKTGVSPPANAPRGSNGFEDFGAYLAKATELTNKDIERERKKNAIISRNARKMSVATFVDDGEDDSELYREESMSVINSDIDSSRAPHTYQHTESQHAVNGRNGSVLRKNRGESPDSASSPVRTAHDSELLNFGRGTEEPLLKKNKRQINSRSPQDRQLSEGLNPHEKGKQKAFQNGYDSDGSDGGDGFDYDQGPQDDDHNEEPEPLEDIPEENEEDGDLVNGETIETREAKATQPKRRKQNSRPPPPSNGIRRSDRQRLPRLAHWRGERVVYGRSRTPVGNLPVVGMVDVVRVPTEPAEPFAAARSRRAASRRIKSESVPPGSQYQGLRNDENEVDSETTSSGVVFSQTKQSECWRRVVSTRRDQSAGREKLAGGNDQFQFQRLFTESDFAASGILYIPIGKAKPTKASKDNCYDFIVLRGNVSVKIHRTNFVVGPEGMVHVPRGNLYSLENVGDCIAKIAFSQSRRITAGSDPDEESDGVEQPLDERSDVEDEIKKLAQQPNNNDDDDDENEGQQTS